MYSFNPGKNPFNLFLVFACIFLNLRKNLKWGDKKYSAKSSGPNFWFLNSLWAIVLLRAANKAVSEGFF